MPSNVSNCVKRSPCAKKSSSITDRLPPKADSTKDKSRFESLGKSKSTSSLPLNKGNKDDKASIKKEQHHLKGKASTFAQLPCVYHMHALIKVKALKSLNP